MSTRRARIKAVASLPVRRKNVNDNSDPKEALPIDSTKRNVQSTNDNTKGNEQSSEANTKPNSEISTITTNNIIVNESRTPEKDSLEKVDSTSKSLYKNVLSSSLLSPQIIKKSPLKSNGTPKSITQNQIEKHIQEDYVTSKGFYDNQESDKDTNTKNKTSKSSTHTLIETVSKLAAATENDTDDAVFDGIVPLESKVSKPLETLKNQIISENTEVLFDPIVPLPSPNKGRPKLRPVPRLAPLRRNSIQGSASESEDENRRSLLNSNLPLVTPRQRHDSYTMGVTQISQPPREVTRVRNDSVSSIMSQNTFLANVPLSPLKDNKQLISKTKRMEGSRMLSGTRRRQRVRDNVNKESLTMYDLIFYNPATNPIIPNTEEEKILNDSKETTKKEEHVEEPPPEPKEESAPVPQIKIGPNGEIVIDETSLVIKQTEGPRKLSSSVIHEGDWTTSGKGRYTRAPRAADWSDSDTVRFYRALAAVGTDFSMMAPLFPNRTRRELKIKFKKEEKLNCPQVDKALRSHLKWDVTNLEEEFRNERREEKEIIERERKLLADERRKEVERLRSVRSMGLRIAKGVKAMEIIPRRKKLPRNVVTANDLLREAAVANNSKPKMFTTSTASILTKVGIPASTESSIPIKQNKTTPEINNTSITPKIPKSSIPKNIENGSLVVLSVNDPNSPTKKLLQTYISDGKGCLTPVDLRPAALNSVINYMNEKKSATNPMKSPPYPSVATAGQEKTKITTPGLDKLSPGPSKRIRHDSYSITQL